MVPCLVQVEYDFQFYKMEMPVDIPVLVLSQVTFLFYQLHCNPICNIHSTALDIT